MSVPTTYDEVKTTWSNQVFTSLMAGEFDPTGWAAITLPEEGKECNTFLFKAKVFPVDVDALVTLCDTVAACTFDSTAYSSLAFGFALVRGLDSGLAGGNCEVNHPYLFTKDDSVLPFDSVIWAPG